MPQEATKDTGVVPDVKKADADISGSDSDSSIFQTREGITFDTAGLESHYKPLDSYEGAHRYDPKFAWEPSEEKRVVRKVR